MLNFSRVVFGLYKKKTYIEVSTNNIDLMKNVNEIYSAKLEDFFELFFEKMHKSHKEFIACYLIGLFVCQTVNSKKLAKQLNGDVKSKSNEQRIRNFYCNYEIDYTVIAMIMFSLLKPKKVKLSIDRTNWKFGESDINIFAMTAYYHGLGVPLFWDLLAKRGSSNIAERIDLLEFFVNQFGIDHIEYITADREFIGYEWIKYLKSHNISFFIRIRKNTDVFLNGKEYKAENLVTSRQEKCFMDVKIWGVRLNLSVKMIDNPKDPEDNCLLIITNLLPLNACECYRNRWSIENCFSCWKTRGLNIEDTHMIQPQRLKKLVAMVALAYLFCVHVGVWSDANQKKIPIKKHGYKEQSFFRKGLDLLDNCIKHINQKIEELKFYIGLTINELQRNYSFYMFRKKGYEVSNLKIVG